MLTRARTHRSVATKKASARSFATHTRQGRDVVIVSAARTPIGSFGGSLSSLTAPQLGVVAAKAAIDRAGIKPDQVEQVYFGNVISSNLGQAPARQVALGAGLPVSTVTTTINKVCASGMKAIMVAAQTIQLNQADIILAGGMESMSNVPFYVDGRGARFGGISKFGHSTLIDGLVRDGLSDASDNQPMGTCAENTVKAQGITRKEQDDFAILSYKRAAESTKNGLFAAEIVPVKVPQKKGDPITVSEDEEFKKANIDKIPTLKPVFDKAGSVTAANSSSLNDGASALILMSADKAKSLGLKPLARILGYGDAEMKPIDFPIAPSLAVPKALAMAGLKTSDVDFWEFNEAFAAVILANMKLLGVSVDKINVRGGAIALGHPIGNSGSRIVTTLTHLLQQTPSAKIGAASICNGGGGASAIVIEKL